MASTAERRRAWTGPALLSFGFRPFFLLGSLWAAVAMILWITMLAGGPALPTAFDPVSWHAHEFLFGYLGAIVAGFLLTAVPNWTGRLPVTGWPLAGLAGLWLAGRVAVATSAHLSPLMVAVIDLAFPLALIGFLGREIVAGRNWRNLAVLVMLAVFATANALFHWEAAQGVHAAQGAGLRLGLAAGVMMIAVIGGRIVPSFTRNWLVKRGKTELPVPPMRRFDKLALLALVLALAAWVPAPLREETGALLILAGLVHAARLLRWQGRQTGAEPLVWVLHAGYAFVPLGALALGLAALAPGLVTLAAAQHIWMAGGVGLMTMAVMTRASRGHGGRDLQADAGTTTLYIALIGATVLRLVPGVWPSMAGQLHHVSGALWVGAFFGFAVLYGPMLMLGKPEGG